MKEIDFNIEYPPKIQPGEDRFFNKGLEITPFKGKFYLEIRCSDIIISSSQIKDDNKITIKGTKIIQTLPLHYSAIGTAKLDARKEIGVFIYRKKIQWWNLLFLILASLIWLSPTLIILFRPSIINFQIGIGEFFIINIPQYVLFALLFSLKRVSYIFNKIITYRISQIVFKDSYGTFDFISIVNESTYKKENMVFKVKY